MLHKRATRSASSVAAPQWAGQWAAQSSSLQLPRSNDALKTPPESMFLGGRRHWANTGTPPPACPQAKRMGAVVFQFQLNFK